MVSRYRVTLDFDENLRVEKKYWTSFFIFKESFSPNYWGGFIFFFMLKIKIGDCFTRHLEIL